MFCTVGYQDATLETVIARLKAARVATVADVRAVASSRRAGFSKTVLRESLAAEEIGYLHLRGLGTPKPGRDAARKGRTAEMRAIFEAHLGTEAAMADWPRLVAAVRAERVALLCFCARPEGCHRRVLSERLAAALGGGWTDL